MTEHRSDKTPFRKMHGLGNDFVMFDARQAPVRLTRDILRALGDRNTGIGFDQLILIERSLTADAKVRFFNPDGSEAGACGNGTRCVAAVLDPDGVGTRLTVETLGGRLTVQRRQSGLVTVDMGAPKRDWQDIPLAWAQDTDALDYRHGPLAQPVAVNMGNPHVVFFISPAENIDLGVLGPDIETDALFPERANVSLVEVLDRGCMRLAVWERAAGLTRACGSAACAAVVAGVARGLTDRKVDVYLPGGKLHIEMGDDDDHVLMTGPIAHSFDGAIDLATIGTH